MRRQVGKLSAADRVLDEILVNATDVPNRRVT